MNNQIQQFQQQNQPNFSDSSSSLFSSAFAPFDMPATTTDGTSSLINETYGGGGYSNYNQSN